jgi:hypothetical protein
MPKFVVTLNMNNNSNETGRPNFPGIDQLEHDNYNSETDSTTEHSQSQIPPGYSVEHSVSNQGVINYPNSAIGNKKPLMNLPNTVKKIEEILIFSYFFVSAMLVMRFVLSLFGASRQSIFVDLLHQTTTPFMIPFEGMFGGGVASGQFRIEFEALVGLVVYALIFYGIAKLIRILLQ